MTDTCKACQAELAQLRSEKAAIVARLEAAQRLRDAVQGYLNVPTDTMAVDLEDALAAFNKEQQ